jgi:hypothetical protein
VATWPDLIEYIRSNYQITEEKPHVITILFDTTGVRSQFVVLSRQTLDNEGDEDWLMIESPIGQVAKLDLERALTEVGKTVCGGAAIQQNLLLLRHAVPLANLDPNEFERPLHLVTITADRLERELIGDDTF